MSGNTPPGVHSELTARQQQILDLMQDGKVNKEIASQLGIGVGTVKQHIVALFKKLNVSNRAMAVSKGMSLQQGQESMNAALTAAEGMMERRPCVVLSIALPEQANPLSVRKLHSIMAALAYDNDVLFLTRKVNAGDIIFGVQRVTEYDMVKALQTAHSIFNELLTFDSVLAHELRGGLTAGLAGASMNRFGGWTGEAIASSAIAVSRDLMRDVPSGYLAVGKSARDLMLAFGIGNNQEIPSEMIFSALYSLRWTGERNSFGLIGRRSEFAVLNAALEESKKFKGSLIYLEGETGMGKSRLCKEISECCIRMGGQVLFFRCLPVSASGDEFFNTYDGNVYSTTEMFRQFKAPLTQFPELLIVDDFQILSKEKQQALAVVAANEVAKGRLVVLSGRRRVDGLTGNFESILLRRLSIDAVEDLVREVLGDQAVTVRSKGIHSIALTAAGVPLFAVELARHFGDKLLALPLMVVICARLDNLRLDRELLRKVARGGGNLTLETATVEMGDDIEFLRKSVDTAIAAGVLALAADGCLTFSHPMLRQVIDFIGME